MKRIFAILIAAASLSLGACANNGSASGFDVGPREGIGGLLGAIAGGAAGSQIGKGDGQLVATGAGAVIGLLVGSEIGRGLDDISRMKAQRAAQQALEHKRSGSSVRWNNPDQDARGTVTPRRTYQKPSGTYCREYATTISVGGQVQKGFGTACRQPDGTWKLQ